MARLNILRSLCAASLLAISATPAVAAESPPADAELPPVVVRVHADRFQGPGGDGRVYARPGQTILFELVDPADTRHTVTVERADCHTRYPWLCEQRFDNPRDDTVDFRFSVEGEYGFYDRYAREADREMTGRFIITAAPPPIPPSTTTTTTTTTTAPPTTTPTTAPTTTTSTAPTTTTAPSSIRPFLIPDPAPTTTTAAQPAPPPPDAATAAPAGDKDKDKNRDKDTGRSKAAGTETPATDTPAPPEAPPDMIFDPASLTPGPATVPDIFGSDSGDEAALEAAALADLLDPASAESDGSDGRLTLYGLGVLALVLLVAGAWAWQHRSSRYFPA